MVCVLRFASIILFASLVTAVPAGSQAQTNPKVQALWEAVFRETKESGDNDGDGVPNAVDPDNYVFQQYDCVNYSAAFHQAAADAGYVCKTVWGYCFNWRTGKSEWHSKCYVDGIGYIEPQYGAVTGPPSPVTNVFDRPNSKGRPMYPGYYD